MTHKTFLITSVAFIACTAMAQQTPQSQPPATPPQSQQDCGSGGAAKAAKHLHVTHVPRFLQKAMAQAANKTGIDVAGTVADTVKDSQKPHPCPVSAPPPAQPAQKQ